MFAFAVPANALAAVEPAAANQHGKMLFCDYGSLGFMPRSPPPGFESQFAVAVVEIDSPRESANVSVSDFELFDEAGKATKLKRVINVETFDRPPRPANDVEDVYYDDNRSLPTWNGALPVGTIRLRIRVALDEGLNGPVQKRCRVVVGPYVIEGASGGQWPTS